MDSSHSFGITTAVQPGNSGGLLINEQGQVAGVVTARLSDVAARKELIERIAGKMH